MSEEGVERKLAAILAADVVDYSRLMGKAEAVTLAVLSLWVLDLPPLVSSRHTIRTFTRAREPRTGMAVDTAFPLRLRRPRAPHAILTFSHQTGHREARLNSP